VLGKTALGIQCTFFGLSAYGQGFHFIKSAETEEGIKDMANIALITITEGVANAKQIEAEFKLKAGPESTWRWYAKKIDENFFSNEVSQQ
jgi:hypothetical protein